MKTTRHNDNTHTHIKPYKKNDIFEILLAVKTVVIWPIIKVNCNKVNVEKQPKKGIRQTLLKTSNLCGRFHPHIYLICNILYNIKLFTKPDKKKEKKNFPTKTNAY